MDELNKILNKINEEQILLKFHTENKRKIKSLNGQIKNITLKLPSYKHNKTKKEK